MICATYATAAAQDNHHLAESYPSLPKNLESDYAQVGEEQSSAKRENSDPRSQSGQRETGRGPMFHHGNGHFPSGKQGKHVDREVPGLQTRF